MKEPERWAGREGGGGHDAGVRGMAGKDGVYTPQEQMRARNAKRRARMFKGKEMEIPYRQLNDEFDVRMYVSVRHTDRWSVDRIRRKSKC